MPQYWLISVPLEGGASGANRTWEQLQDRTSRQELCEASKFSVPELRVGTLDSLLQLSDDLTKVATLVDSVTSKIRRQLADLGQAESLEDLTVDGYQVERYLTSFSWNEAKYPARRPLRETADKLSEGVARLEDELKVKIAEYNGVKGQLAAIQRKTTGSLAVRDLSDIAQKHRLVDSENLTTLLVAVSKHSAKDWFASYDKLTQFVVPRSSKLLLEEGDYQLYTVVLFKRVVDEFKHAARDKSFQVRDVTFDQSALQAQQAEMQTLQRDANERKSNLAEWCRTSYGEAFSALVHVFAVRVFVESILRYGLPPCFVSAILKPANKQEKRLRQVLSQSFARNASAHWKEDTENPVRGAEEVHPYVSFSLEVS